MTRVHDFKEQLDYSLQTDHEPFWEAVYRKAFPTMIGMSTITDMGLQRFGIDRIIKCPDRLVFVDEKKREETWSDILLEYISVDTTGAPGWVEKDLLIDYITYAFMSTKTVYLLPWVLLKRAWIDNKEDWKRRFKIVSAKNSNYTTHSVAVPISVLIAEINEVLVIKVK